MNVNWRSLLFAVLVVVSLASLANAAAMRPGFNSSSLAGNDDGSTGFTSFGFSSPLDFYSSSISGAYLNNNGNMTFTGPLFSYTPWGITGGSMAMIAPFFADVDTRTGELMRYGGGTADGHPAFGVTWNGVGYFYQHLDKLNEFQMILHDRSDVGPGDFDIEFNYDQIQWETGDASSGSSGIGGSPARVGWTNGAGSYFELPGSGISLAFLDSTAGPYTLITHSMNSSVAGRYVFNVRNGTVVTPPPVVGAPEPGSLLLLGSGLLALVSFARRRANV